MEGKPLSKMRRGILAAMAAGTFGISSLGAQARPNGGLGRTSLLNRERERKSAAKYVYKVAKGDTLISICREHEVDRDEVAAINELSPPYKLRIGRVLYLTSAAAYYYRYYMD